MAALVGGHMPLAWAQGQQRAEREAHHEARERRAGVVPVRFPRLLCLRIIRSPLLVLSLPRDLLADMHRQAERLLCCPSGT